LLFVSSPLYDLFCAAVRRNSILDTPECSAHFNNLNKAFLNAEVFVSTNVTQYYFAGTDQEFWHLGRHFPNLAPVYDSFWIETKAPTHIKSSVYGVQSWNLDDTKLYRRPKRWGAWFLNISPDSVVRLQNYEDIFGHLPMDSSWIYAISLYTQHENEQKIEPMWTFYLLVNKADGQLVRNPEITAGNNPYLFGSYALGQTKEDMAELQAVYGNAPELTPGQNADSEIESVPLNIQQIYEVEAMGLVKPLFLALSFLHCKNVVRVPTHPSPHQNKKRTARHLPPFNKFHTLEIRPMQRILQQAIDEYRGVKGASGIEMALHKVRGHFKSYGSDKPLMGHAVGTWFWAEAARGSKKRGIVTKEYEIKP
jgi:hypothetical protein